MSVKDMCTVHVLKGFLDTIPVHMLCCTAFKWDVCLLNGPQVSQLKSSAQTKFSRGIWRLDPCICFIHRRLLNWTTRWTEGFGYDVHCGCLGTEAIGLYFNIHTAVYVFICSNFFFCMFRSPTGDLSSRWQVCQCVFLPQSATGFAW
jgi:hypothetical protein